MNDVITIAESTFARIARMKSVYFILLILVADVWAMSNYGELSLGMAQELMIDCALAVALVVGLITSMVAAFEIPRELREKTAQFILSKPGGRSSFVWGKFLGVSGLCLFNIAILAAGSLLVMKLEAGPESGAALHLLRAYALIAVEAIMLTGVGLLLGTFLQDSMAAIGVFIVFAGGHAVYMLPRAMHQNPIGQLLYYVLPNFHHLDVKTAISHGLDIPDAFVLHGVVYGLAYAVALTALASIVFSRKDVA